jgi:hypothetical protein
MILYFLFILFYFIFFFFNVTQESDILLEWEFWMKRGFPAFIAAHPQADLFELMDALVQENKYANDYPILRDLSAVGWTVSVSNAVVEDSFSTMGLVKDPHTNQFDDESVDDILQVKLNGPPEMPVCPSVCVCC